MIVTPIDAAALGYPRVILGPESDTPIRSRDARPHLTTILRDMAKTAGISKDGVSGFDDSDLDWFAAGGWLWERVFDMAHREAIDRGELVNMGEIECDGIVATPDRVDLLRSAVIELKVRWKSAKKFDTLERDFWIEIMQVKAYCAMLQMCEADLIVFFVAGNWRPPTPIVRGANLVFSETELGETWEQIVRHAKSRGMLL